MGQLGRRAEWEPGPRLSAGLLLLLTNILVDANDGIAMNCGDPAQTAVFRQVVRDMPVRA